MNVLKKDFCYVGPKMSTEGCLLKIYNCAWVCNFHCFTHAKEDAPE